MHILGDPRNRFRRPCWTLYHLLDGALSIVPTCTMCARKERSFYGESIDHYQQWLECLIVQGHADMALPDIQTMRFSNMLLQFTPVLEGLWAISLWTIVLEHVHGFLVHVLSLKLNAQLFVSKRCVVCIVVFKGLFCILREYNYFLLSLMWGGDHQFHHVHVTMVAPHSPYSKRNCEYRREPWDEVYTCDKYGGRIEPLQMFL